jgi:hypothetical protein
VEAHVSSTDFLPGSTVGLYPPQTRPDEHHEPLATAQVPAGGQVVFERDAPRERYWIAGRDLDGRWKTVQCHSKPGGPVNVRAALELTRREEDSTAPIVGSVGTIHTPAVRRRQAAKKA